MLTHNRLRTMNQTSLNKVVDILVNHSNLPRKQVEDHILELFPNMAMERRNNKGRREPYYNQRYAETVRPLLDHIISEGSRGTFSVPAVGNLQTFYAKFYQGWAYLAEHTGGEPYLELKKGYMLKRDFKAGVLQIIPRMTKIIFEEAKLEIHKIASAFPWEDKLMEFLEKTKVPDKLSLKGLELTEEDIIQAKQLMCDRDDLAWAVSKTEILAVRNTVEEITKMKQQAATTTSDKIKS